MPNTLTNLIPDLYRALDVVSRELVGFIPAVTLDAQASRAAVGQVVRSPVAPAAPAEDITPSTNPPDTGDQTFTNKTLQITKSRAVPFRWTGEEQLGLNNNGPGYLTLRQQQMAQAMRTLVNEIEADLAGLFKLASRAYGTAGTTPFGSTPNIGDSAQILKILKDNGCPDGDLQLVVDTSAGANLRSLPSLYRVNEAGDQGLLRQGILGQLHGFDIRESGQIRAVTKGTGASYTTNTAGYAVGTRSITLITGTGTILAGDTVTFAGDTNKYVVETGIAAPGTIVLAAPGLRQAIPTSATAVTVGNTATSNVAFHRSALVLLTRAPALPEEGDAADDRMVVQDPRSGLAFEVAVYAQYRRVRYEIGIAWGVQNVKSEHSALLIG